MSMTVCGARRGMWFQETVLGEQQHSGCNVNNKPGRGWVKEAAKAEKWSKG